MASISQSSEESIVMHNKNRQKPNNMKTLNELLLRPNLTVKRTLLIKHAVKKVASQPNRTSKIATSTKKVQVSNLIKKVERPKRIIPRIIPHSKEYYPDRLKRKMPSKKIVLQPRHEYKVIATTNKRKRKIPCREVKTPPRVPDLTMQELVLAAEQQLDDEDLMEILTCPSPVWWEDAADQEEIYIRFHEDTYDDARKSKSTPFNFEMFQEIKSKANNNIELNLEPCNIRNKGALKNDLNFFTKFVEKRSKLENVLGFIKFKKTIHDEPQKSVASKVRKDSTSGVSDASVNEEELLNDLQNIEIPVAKINSNKDRNIEEKKIKDVKKVSNIKSLKSNENSSVAPTQVLRRTTRVRKAKQLFKIDEDKQYKPVKRTSKQRTNEITENVPTDLPTLTKNPFRNEIKSFGSPKSMESTASENANSSVMEFDSISDTNIKFLDEDEEEKIEFNKKEIKNPKKISPRKTEGDLVTVYRILPSDSEKMDIEEQIKFNVLSKYERDLNTTEVNADDRKQNTFHRKNKTTYKNKMKGANMADGLEAPNVATKTSSKRAVRHANKKVNYCHKCFSIFETESCQYCVKKNVRKSVKPS